MSAKTLIPHGKKLLRDLILQFGDLLYFAESKFCDCKTSFSFWVLFFAIFRK